ncbi:myelin-oligodendrocyte glycoprotein-like [Etheostoma cragini]|uniref:myelin-oligodendrocyte glycoprotein-like n=1 Tax=Etheostoma cragini TaxID=417921 RepID=UPI00155EEE78|nr:myelin-oligodendrocyte glycoprotein-like [Etheostoma cragini]
MPWQITANLPQDATVKWTRHNVSTYRINVHVFENGRDQDETQDLAYTGRTQMRKNPLRTGDLGLTLINPTHSDSTLYTGTVCRDGDVLWERQVHLNVKARRHY